jgi:hypothetical protein
MQNTKLSICDLYFENSVKNKTIHKKNPVDILEFHKNIQISCNFSDNPNLTVLKNLYKFYCENFHLYDNYKKRNFGNPYKLLKLHPNCRNLKYYLDRGYSEEFGLSKIKKLQATCNIEIAKKIQSTLKNNPNLDKINKSKGNSNRWEFYLDKINPNTNLLFTEIEAREKIYNKQRTGFVNLWKNHKNGTKEMLTNMQLKYYLNKGLDLQDAKNALVERKLQGAFTLENCILKYGKEIGTNKFIERQIKWRSTMNSKSDEDKNQIKIKQRLRLPRVSSVSIKLFESIISSLNLCIDDVYFNNPEYFIYDDLTKRLYFYDFVIPSKKIAIEYNGTTFHPKPDATEEEKLTWFNPLKKMNYFDNLIFDNYKNNLIIQKGYDLLVVWDDDPFKLEKCIEFIKNKIV